MTEPIQINASATPGALAAAVRQVLLVAGGWAVGKGYLDNDTVTALITIAVIVGPLVYGQIKGIRTHEKLVTVAEAAPDRVAEVK